MEWGRRCMASLLCFLFTASFSQSFVTPATRNLQKQSSADQKTYYSTDPHNPNTPKHRGGDCRKKPECSCSPTPSHGGGSHHGGSTPPSHGGGGYNPSPPLVSLTPPTPTILPPLTPDPNTPPSHGGGGYYGSPPLVPSPPLVDPNTPTPYFTPTPTSPSIFVPPAPPLIPDPNTPVPFGTFNYWSTHPTIIWGLFGYWTTIGGVFGLPAATPFPFGSTLTVQEALGNTRTDGIGALLREGTASLLNSMVSKKFPFTTQQVKDAFTAAVTSNKAAAKQAELFKQANEGHHVKH